MKLYHIDKYGVLFPGQTIELKSITAPCKISNLFPDGLSMYGRDITGLINIPQNILPNHCVGELNWQQLNAFNYELVFELIRQQYFSQLPSRFQCFFATDEDNLNHWLTRLHGKPKPPIYEISFNHNNYCKLDETFLQGGIGLYNSATEIKKGPYSYSVELFLNNAFSYWSGESSSEPHWEYLITPPITIGHRIKKL